MNRGEKSDRRNRRREDILSYLPFFSLPKIFKLYNQLGTNSHHFPPPLSLLIDNRTVRESVVPSKFLVLVIDLRHPFSRAQRDGGEIKREMARPSLRKRHFKSYAHGHDSYTRIDVSSTRGWKSFPRWGGKNASRRGMMSKCETAQRFFHRLFSLEKFPHSREEISPEFSTWMYVKMKLVRVSEFLSACFLSVESEYIKKKRRRRRKKGYNHDSLRYEFNVNNYFVKLIL